MTDSEKISDLNNGMFVCFSESTKIAEGSLADVALAAWNFAQSNPLKTTLTFDRKTGAVVDLDLSGKMSDVAARYAKEFEAPKRGRPRLGVTPREVTLLPRHWDWLAEQPGGASVTLRRLVEAARKSSTVEDQSRDRIAAAYKFMSAVAGDRPHFEEASRALFARRFDNLNAHTKSWPTAIKAELQLYLQSLSAAGD